MLGNHLQTYIFQWVPTLTTHEVGTIRSKKLEQAYSLAIKLISKSLIFNKENGEPDRIRTCDQLIKSQLLYQLS